MACSGREGATWQRIREQGVLRIGLDPTYPPFAAMESGELYGLDVELARALAANLGLEAAFVPFAYDGLYDALATKQVDLLLSALVIRPELTAEFAYSEPYFNGGQILVTPASGTSIRTMEDLSGRALAVELGAEGHVIATEWQRRLSQLDVHPHGTAEEAMQAVADGKADAALVDSIGGRLFVSAHDELVVSSEPVTVEPFAAVVRKEDEMLLKKVNESLGRLQASGRLQQLTDDWFDKR
jgi:polar amino acid transport system substrate-binding protein